MKLTFVHLEIIAAILLFGAIVAWTIFQWHECRDMGFSFWYCVQHVA